ncbi:unnamed protein product [Caretta caretta]
MEAVSSFLKLDFLVHLGHVEAAKLVFVNKGISVERGQVVYVRDNELRFNVAEERNPCKVEVVLNEPVTQRVGKPTPQMFDCHFLPNEVKYIHNGCPLLEEDHVRAANLPTENVWILVRIKEAIPNTQARAAFMSMFILEIDQNRKRQISVQHYQIPTRVVYYHLEDHTKAITSFIRQDLYHMKITYQPPNITHSERQNYEVEFQAIASAFMSSSPIMVHFSTRSAKTDAPRVAWNMGIPVSTFLKRDVFHGLIYYHHLEGEIFQDLFDFILSDCLEPPNLSGIYDVAKLIFTDSMKSYKQDPAIPMLTSSFRFSQII